MYQVSSRYLNFKLNNRITEVQFSELSRPWNIDQGILIVPQGYESWEERLFLKRESYLTKQRQRIDAFSIVWGYSII